ncbi:MAG: class I SAM-dependent methyltransferase [Verrucomicrobia bacterium]|nr:class I SAM-dependent methyltransferase [Verrucomicrobiota bacterium]
MSSALINQASKTDPFWKGTRKNQALSFIDSIESTWKGHEAFALWLIQALKPRTTLDLGFDRALSTIAFTYKNKGDVFAIDWFDEGNYSEKSFALESAFRNVQSAIRMGISKNIHLIIGPFGDISKDWSRKIDLFHMDWIHTYTLASQNYETWKKFLKPDAVILVHDVEAYPSEVGRFFNQLPLPKLIFPHAQGLGIATSNLGLLASIEKEWGLKKLD